MRLPLPKTFSQKKLNKNIILIFIFALILNLANWLFLISNVKPKVDPIPLHYNIYFGIDLIGQWYFIYAITLSGLLIIIINFWLALIQKKEAIFLKYILLSSALTAQIFLLLASIFIIRQTG